MNFFDFLLVSVLKGIGAVIKAVFLIGWNLVAYLINTIVIKHTFKEVEKHNLIARNIADGGQITADSVFPNGFESQVFISGGKRDSRTELLCAGIKNTPLNHPLVIIHRGNTKLESSLYNSYANIVNDSNPCYDPFYLRTDSEIQDIILNAVPDDYHLEYSVSDYIDGLLMFLKLKGARPTLQGLIHCPHSELINIISTQISKGRIDPRCGRQIIQKLTSGQSERYKLEKFFRELEQECSSLLYHPSKNNLPCCDMLSSVYDGKRFVINVETFSPILMNILFSQIQLLNQRYSSLNVIIDDIILQTDRIAIKNFIERPNCNLIISTTDLNAMLANDDSFFHTVFSNTAQKFIFNHNSSVSALKISENIGTYSKKEIAQGMDEVKFTLNAPMLIGIPKHHAISEKDVPRVTTDDLQKISEREFFRFNISENKWEHLEIK